MIMKFRLMYSLPSELRYRWSYDRIELSAESKRFVTRIIDYPIHRMNKGDKNRRAQRCIDLCSEGGYSAACKALTKEPPLGHTATVYSQLYQKHPANNIPKPAKSPPRSPTVRLFWRRWWLVRLRVQKFPGEAMPPTRPH